MILDTLLAGAGWLLFVLVTSILLIALIVRTNGAGKFRHR